MTRLFVIVEGAAAPWVLNLEPFDATAARAAIAWQHRGGNMGPFHICEYDRERGEFASVESGQRFTPDRGAFTEQAWADFLARLNGEA